MSEVCLQKGFFLTLYHFLCSYLGDYRWYTTGDQGRCVITLLLLRTPELAPGRMLVCVAGALVISSEHRLPKPVAHLQPAACSLQEQLSPAFPGSRSDFLFLSRKNGEGMNMNERKTNVLRDFCHELCPVIIHRSTCTIIIGLLFFLFPLLSLPAILPLIFVISLSFCCTFPLNDMDKHQSLCFLLAERNWTGCVHLHMCALGEILAKIICILQTQPWHSIESSEKFRFLYCCS